MSATYVPSYAVCATGSGGIYLFNDYARGEAELQETMARAMKLHPAVITVYKDHPDDASLRWESDYEPVGGQYVCTGARPADWKPWSAEAREEARRAWEGSDEEAEALHMDNVLAGLLAATDGYELAE